MTDTSGKSFLILNLLFNCVYLSINFSHFSRRRIFLWIVFLWLLKLILLILHTTIVVDDVIWTDTSLSFIGAQPVIRFRCKLRIDFYSSCFNWKSSLALHRLLLLLSSKQIRVVLLLSLNLKICWWWHSKSPNLIYSKLLLTWLLLLIFLQLQLHLLLIRHKLLHGGLTVTLTHFKQLLFLLNNVIL